jgi:hypothetical protein
VSDYQGGWLPRAPVGQLTLLDPRARTTDPAASHLAAESVARGNQDLIKAIRAFVWSHGPSTAFEVAAALEGRWQSDTVRSALARAGLTKFDGGETPRGRPCSLYALQSDPVATNGRL